MTDPKKNSCTRDFVWDAMTSAAAPRSPALRHTTLPIESVSTSALTTWTTGSGLNERSLGRKRAAMKASAFLMSCS